jgi:hypothetical protein
VSTVNGLSTTGEATAACASVLTPDVRSDAGSVLSPEAAADYSWRLLRDRAGKPIDGPHRDRPPKHGGTPR